MWHLDELKVSWDASTCVNSFIRSVIRDVTTMT
jgi:hypothetical protein